MSANGWREILSNRESIKEAITSVMNDESDMLYTRNLGGDVFLKVQSKHKFIDIRKYWNPTGRMVPCTDPADPADHPPERQRSRHRIPEELTATRRGVALKFSEFAECMKHSDRIIHDLKITLNTDAV